MFAAGRGERMRPLSDVVPKAALPVADIPLAAFTLCRLAALAVPLFVNASHLPDVVRARLSGIPGVARKLTFTLEAPEAYGTAGTLASLRGHLAPTVLTANADLVSDLDPAALLRHHRVSGAPATLAAIEVDVGADFEVRAGSIVGFIDRRSRPDAAGARFIGVAVFARAVLNRLPGSRPAGLGETLVARLARAGEAALHLHRGYAYDVSDPRALHEVSKAVVAGRVAPPYPLPGRILRLPGGAAYLGSGAAAEDGSLGPGGIVLAGARVPPDAHVADALVWEGERVAPGAEVRSALWFQGRAIPLS